ncbi:MAG: lysine 2,3-aminomutase [Dysgonamonadaceae bacterium]|jgi:KamA family protein|nr:lysine 2,3-aminomutase [Dysgonamonadaceae bacterium]
MEKMSYQTFTRSNYEQIPEISRLGQDDKEAIRVVGQVLPFKTNNYVTEQLINWNNIPSDPIFTLNFPRKEMLPRKLYHRTFDLLNRDLNRETLKSEVNRIRMELNPNPAGQEHNVPVMDDVRLHGIQHKYRETVLFFPSQGQTCHAYCTFCFRWPQFSGMNELKFSMKEADLLFKYLKQKHRVTDILFTGGDPLTMSTNTLVNYIKPLLEKDFKHIHTIRLGTKSLSYWPYRFLSDKDSDELIALFEKIVKSGKNLTIQAHFNHPVELGTDAVKQAISRILNTGAQIRTQSPVLRKINDHPDIWSEMWRKQVDLNCIPYYMFVARDTGAKQFFELPLEKCWKIFRKAYSQVSGTCRTVRGPSMSCEPGKIHVLGVAEVKGEKVFVLRFLQGRNTNWVDVPFFAKYDPEATWIDQLRPAFGDEKFFFELDDQGYKYLNTNKNDLLLE